MVSGACLIASMAQGRYTDSMRELWTFLKARKKMWLLPIFLVLILISFAAIIASSSVAAPFIYTLF